MMNVYRSISSSIALAFGISLISAGETGGNTVSAIPMESTAITELTDTVGNDPKADSSKTLSEVVVKAERVVRRDNMLLLFPSRQDKRFASGGLGVLDNMNIPEVMIDPTTQEIKTPGGEAIEPFIDFIPANNQQLKNIRPQDIERIDIIRSPKDPRFKDARIVANFIMKKYVYGGYTKIDAMQRFPVYNGEYSIYSKMSYKRMSYDIWGGTSYEKLGNETGEENHSIFRFSQGTVERTSRTESNKSLTVSPSVAARAIYNARNMMILNQVSFNYSRRNPADRTSSVAFSDLFNPSTSTSTANGKNKGVAWNGNYYFSLPANSSLNVTGNFSWTENRDNTTYQLKGNPAIVNDISETIYYALATATYSKRLGAHSIGAYAYGSWTRNEVDYVSNAMRGVDYTEGYAGLRASADLQFNSFMISPNVSINYYSKHLNGRVFNKWYPKTFIPFYVQLSPRQSINGSFEFAIGGPETSQISPVLVRTNEVEAIRGNEYIEDYQFYNARLGYSHYFGSWLKARFDVGFNMHGNAMVPKYTEEMSAEGTPLMVEDVVNNGNSSDTDLTLTLAGDYFDKKLSVRLMGSATYFAQRGAVNRNKWSATCSAQATYYLGDFRISAYFTPPTKYYSRWMDTKMPIFYFVSGAWSWNDLFVELRFSNPFRKSHVAYWRDINSPLFTSHSVALSPSHHQSVKLTISYSFGYGKKVNRQDEVRTLNGAPSIILKKD